MAGRRGVSFLDPELLLPFHRTDTGSYLCFDRSAAPVSDTWPVVDFARPVAMPTMRQRLAVVNTKDNRRTALRVDQAPVIGEELVLQTFCSGTGGRWAERRVRVRGDRGGPVRRLESRPPLPDFQFPQMGSTELAPHWHPLIFDYIYVSFTNSIAFSPTDVLPLTRRAKALMLSESTVSAVTILLVAARAVNILK